MVNALRVPPGGPSGRQPAFSGLSTLAAGGGFGASFGVAGPGSKGVGYSGIAGPQPVAMTEPPVTTTKSPKREE
jgi:hypothetical protein